MHLAVPPCFLQFVAYHFFPCRDIFHKMDRFLDDNRIKAMLIEKNSSEEEIGSDEDDNEERVVSESDNDTDSEIEIGQKDKQTDTNVDFGSSEEDYGSDE